MTVPEPIRSNCFDCAVPNRLTMVCEDCAQIRIARDGPDWLMKLTAEIEKAYPGFTDNWYKKPTEKKSTEKRPRKVKEKKKEQMLWEE